MELATSRRQRVGTGTPLVASIAVHLALVVVIAFLRFDPLNAPSARLEPDVQVLVDPPVFQPPPPPLGLRGERRPVQRRADGAPEAELRVPIPQKVDVPTAPTPGTAAPSPDRGPGPAIDRAAPPKSRLESEDSHPPEGPRSDAGELGPQVRADPGSGRFDVARALREFERNSPSRATPTAPPRPGSGATGKVRGGLEIPDLSGLGAPRTGMGNLEFESSDYDWTDYYRQIYWVIWKAWHTRLYYTVDRFERWSFQRGNPAIDHRSGVRFTILRSGQVTGVQVERLSGCPPLDDSAADALSEVVLPPLPDDFPRDRETVHARFYAVGDIRGMRRGLEYLREAGLLDVRPSRGSDSDPR